MMSITAEKLIDHYINAKPRITWEMDRATYEQITRLKDDAGTYLWSAEPNYREMPGTLLGYPIAIAKDQCLNLRFEFIDGHVYVIPMIRVGRVLEP